jgi:hypothetical protein
MIPESTSKGNESSFFGGGGDGNAFALSLSSGSVALDTSRQVSVTGRVASSDMAGDDVVVGKALKQ